VITAETILNILIRVAKQFIALAEQAKTNK
jgi:hypothetical protein